MKHLSKVLFILMFLTFFLVVESAFALSTIKTNDRPVDVAIGTLNNDGNANILDSGQQDLQTILNTIVTDGKIYADTDQQEAGRWEPADGSTDIYAVGMFASKAGTLGIYGVVNEANGTYETIKHDIAVISASNNGTITSIDGVEVAPGDTTFIRKHFAILDNNSLEIGEDTISGNFSNFGFYWEDSYTEDYLNDGKAMTLSYIVKDGFGINTNVYGNQGGYGEDEFTGNDDWIIAFEDGKTEGDQVDDFQDMVIFVKDIKPVPEPASLALLGLGLLGLAGIGRKKFSKK